MDHFLTVLFYSEVAVRSKKGKLGKFNLSQKKKKEKRKILIFEGREKEKEGKKQIDFKK